MLYQILTGQMSPTEVVALLIALVFGITIHEFSHAMAATWLGDTLPGRQGRLTLAPAAHLDVMGSLMFLIGGFGWGRPVQYNPYALRAGPRTGPALVALAGPVSNIILAGLIAIPIRLIIFFMPHPTSLSPESLSALETLLLLLLLIVRYNLLLGLFNLIPIFPLDGFTILLGVLPPQMAYPLEQLRQYGMLILFALLFVGSGVLGALVYGPMDQLASLLTGIRF